MEEPPRQVVAFDIARLVRRPNEGRNDGQLEIRVGVAEDVENRRGDLEDRYIVDLVADAAPAVAESLYPPPPPAIRR